MKLSTLSLDHLGLVAAIFDFLGVSEIIDELIPKSTRNPLELMKSGGMLLW